MRGKGAMKANKQVIAALICGVVCALCVGAYVMQVDSQASAAQADMLARYGGDQVEVCVATRDIAAGETLAESDVDQKMWIATLLPSNAVTNKRDAVGKQIGSAILSGEVISSSRFGFDASNIDVPEGYTALSVPAREVQTVGGALKAGMRTDVYATGTNTVKIASQVLVLESCIADGAAKSSADAWITLALEPAKVQEMVSAAQNLQLYFSLPSGNSNKEEPDKEQSGKKSN